MWRYFTKIGSVKKYGNDSNKSTSIVSIICNRYFCVAMSFSLMIGIFSVLTTNVFKYSTSAAQPDSAWTTCFDMFFLRAERSFVERMEQKPLITSWKQNIFFVKFVVWNWDLNTLKLNNWLFNYRSQICKCTWSRSSDSILLCFICI